MRGLALLGLVTFGFIPAFVLRDAVGRVGAKQVMVEPGSREASIGADHPGETVHIAGALATLVIGGAGLVGLVWRPERDGSAWQTIATAIAMLASAGLAGDPDNYGGQGLLFDPLFAVIALPPLAAGLTARPWRLRTAGWIERPRYLGLAGLALPALWYGFGQGLMQRNTWPPLADPHHQAHWYTMSQLAFLVVLVVATAGLSDRGWGPAAATSAVAAIVLAVASLLSVDAASALSTPWSIVVLLWGLATLVVTYRAVRDERNRGLRGSGRTTSM